jgi:glucan phosphoethanolaminetransferase (alkaline phosphatase superfamily)
MIILAIFLLAMLIAASAIITKLVFKPRWTWLNRIILVMVGLSVVMCVICVIALPVTRGIVNDLREEHDALILYHDTIDQCYNEYVRFDFYQRVMDYNERYAAIQKESKSLWIGEFYPKGWDTEILPIEFLLNSGVNG